MDVTIHRGLEARDNLRSIEPGLWPELIGEYRFFCKRALPADCRELLRMTNEGKQVGWAGYGNRDSYVRDGLGLDPQAVNWALEGLRIAGEKAAIGYETAQDIGRQAAQAQAMAQPNGVAAVAKHGFNQHTGGGSITTSSLGRGAAYIIAKLKRDRPDVAERLAAGEFRSARAAAREAGLVREHPLTDLRRAWKRASEAERDTFRAEISQ